MKRFNSAKIREDLLRDVLYRDRSLHETYAYLMLLAMLELKVIHDSNINDVYVEWCYYLHRNLQ
jgi:hypothetical protein